MSSLKYPVTSIASEKKPSKNFSGKKMTDRRINCIRMITDNYGKREGRLVDVMRSLKNEVKTQYNLNDWNYAPYNDYGNIVYLVIVNKDGRYIRPCKADDIRNMHTRARSTVPWKLTSPGKTDAYFIVAIDDQGYILRGISNGKHYAPTKVSSPPYYGH